MLRSHSSARAQSGCKTNLLRAFELVSGVDAGVGEEAE